MKLKCQKNWFRRMTAPTKLPTRLVLLEAGTVSVYEERKLLAYCQEPYDYCASEIEEMRVADYTSKEAA